jgi:hypothetical protein
LPDIAAVTALTLDACSMLDTRSSAVVESKDREALFLNLVTISSDGKAGDSNTDIRPA